MVCLTIIETIIEKKNNSRLSAKTFTEVPCWVKQQEESIVKTIFEIQLVQAEYDTISKYNGKF